MRMPHVRQRLRRALEGRQDRRRRRAERAHLQDVASRGRDHVDVSTKHWQGGGGGA